MMTARYEDKKMVVGILTDAFDDNQSVNYVVRQDGKRKERIRRLMEYSFDVCYAFGKVLLSNDKKACALVVFPDQKKVTLRSALWDLKLVFSCTGLANARKVMRRETMIKKLQPKEPMYYLWFIGVSAKEQHNGIGTLLLKEIIEESEKEKKVICLETSTLNNLPWYQRHEFVVYNKLNLGYPLFLLKRSLKKR